MLNTTERFGASRQAAQSQPRCVAQPPPESGTYLLQGRRKPYSGFLGIFVLFWSFPKEPCSPQQKNCWKKSSPGWVLYPVVHLFSLRDAKCFLSRDWVKMQLPWNKTQLLSWAWHSWYLKSLNLSPLIREKYPYHTKFNKETFLLFQSWQWRGSSAVQHCLWQ